MQNEKITFTHFLSNLVTGDVQNALPEDFPTLNFFCENWEEIKYPYVSVYYLSNKHDCKGFKVLLTYIDVVFNNFQTYQCDRVTTELLKKLLIYDYHDFSERSTKEYDYSTGIPVETGNKIFWIPSNKVDFVYSPKSELRRNVMSLDIYYVR